MRAEAVSVLSQIGSSWKCSPRRHSTIGSRSSSDGITSCFCPSVLEVIILTASLEMLRIYAMLDPRAPPSSTEESTIVTPSATTSIHLTSSSLQKNSSEISQNATSDERIDILRRSMVREETIWFLCSSIHSCLNLFHPSSPSRHGTRASDEMAMIIEARNVLLSILLVDRKVDGPPQSHSSANRCRTSRRLTEEEAGLIFAAIEAINDVCSCPWDPDDVDMDM
ncbi:uncharacterized protein EI90DRAFT_3041197 [Cantharellus anzutake]|uniref:uncharacterized protein n=1 Tax=Cantharellus anzutake TaxID=1750568 RepID=UPI001908ECF6|nr:uncharacterized protein EI90DRAFT_3041197 [Cantharellus anzutake]KAF8337974.1 hypothetical protein EI90DRAFT_3041197 [Cantharellus anzutake]